MSFVTRSEAFLARSLEDVSAWGVAITLTNPAGTVQELTGQARHISMLLDIESGQEVREEQASVTLRLSSITIGEPVKNWKVSVKDSAGDTLSAYVVESFPDRTLGITVLKLGRLV